MIYMFFSSNPLSGDINLSNLSCWHVFRRGETTMIEMSLLNLFQSQLIWICRFFKTGYMQVQHGYG